MAHARELRSNSREGSAGSPGRRLLLPVPRDEYIPFAHSRRLFDAAKIGAGLHDRPRRSSSCRRAQRPQRRRGFLVDRPVQHGKVVPRARAPARLTRVRDGARKKKREKSSRRFARDVDCEFSPVSARPAPSGRPERPRSGVAQWPRRRPVPSSSRGFSMIWITSLQAGKERSLLRRQASIACRSSKTSSSYIAALRSLRRGASSAELPVQRSPHPCSWCRLPVAFPDTLTTMKSATRRASGRSMTPYSVTIPAISSCGVTSKAGL